MYMRTKIFRRNLQKIIFRIQAISAFCVRRGKRFTSRKLHELRLVPQLKRYLVSALSVLLVISTSGAVFFLRSQKASAASYTWQQTDWSGGADGGSSPIHPTDETGWTKYGSHDGGINVGSGNLTLTSQAGSTTQTTDTDFGNGSQNQTAVSGSGAGGSENLAPGTGYSDYWSTPSASANGGYVGDSLAYPGSGNYVYHITGYNSNFERFDVVHRKWSSLASLYSWAYPGASLVSTGDDYLYVLEGGGNNGFWRYSISQDSWAHMSSVSGVSANRGSALVYPGSGDFIYAQFNFGAFQEYSISQNMWSALTNAPGSDAGSNEMVSDGTHIYELSANNDTTFWSYSIANDSWTTLASTPGNISPNGTIMYPGTGDYAYALVAGGSGAFYRYSISGNSWTAIQSAPQSIDDAASAAYMGAANDAILVNEVDTSNGSHNISLVYSIKSGTWAPYAYAPAALQSDYATRNAGGNGKVYVLNKGTSFYSYDTVTNSWGTLAAPTSAGDYADSLYYPGSGDFVYYEPGDATFYEYSISNNTWTQLANVPGPGFGVIGSNLTGNGTYIYAVSGSNSFYRYSIAHNSWTGLANVPENIGYGNAVIYPGSGDYIFYEDGGNSNFYQYSISNNSWASLAALPGTPGWGAAVGTPGGDNIYVMHDGATIPWVYSISGNSWNSSLQGQANFAPGSQAGFAYPGTGTQLYLLDGYASSLIGYTFSAGYYATGTFTSSQINLAQNSTFTNLTWNSVVPAGTSVKFRIRSASSAGALNSALYYGPTSTSDYYTSSGQAINAVHNGDTWIQYQAYVATTNTAITPSLADITFGYTYYSPSGALISSAYNTAAPTNLLNKIRWTQTVPNGTAVSFQFRSAEDSSGSPGSWSAWMGPDGTNGTYFTDNTGGQSMPSALRSGSNAQWFQYQAFLTTSDGTKTPTLSDTTVTYVVNAPPDFNSSYPGPGGTGVSASQNSDGTVTINYSVRDIDSDSGTFTPGFITPSFEYSVDNGVSWSAITSGSLAGSDLANKAVDTSSYTTYSATWNAKNQINGMHVTNAKVRVQAYDNELANNTVKAASASFSLDTKDPILGGTPIRIAGGVTKVNTRNVTLSLAATDDSTLQEIVSEDSGFAGASYQSFNASTPFVLSSGDGVKTVYVQFKDQFSNVTAERSATITLDTTAPAIPINMNISDISNADQGYRLFIAWNKATESDFGSYQVYRSVDGGSSTLYRTITDVNTNYMYDPGLISSSSYTYTVRAVDDVQNASAQSSSVTATPAYNTANPPVISGVGSGSLTPTSAEIHWTTDIVAQSTVLYSTDTSYANMVGSTSFVTSHSSTINGLAPATTYNYEVKSCGASGLCTTSSAGTFNTSAVSNVPPVISAVASTAITSSQATITWTTDVASTSFVEYSTTNGFSTGSLFGQNDSLTSHGVTLPSGLQPSTTYYYKVHSTDVMGNETVSSQYSFTTLAASGNPPDVVIPTISSVVSTVVSDSGVAIEWITNTPTTSQVAWGTTLGLGFTTVLDSNSTTHHTVSITNLKPGITYYYKVISTDNSGNTVVADNAGQFYAVTTLANLTDPASLSDTQVATLSQQVSAAFLQKFLAGLKNNPNIGQEVYIQAATQAANSIVSAPVISGIDAQVVVGTRSAVISWVTNNASNSLVAYAPSRDYNAQRTQPYTMAAGSPDESVTVHHVTLSNLEPNTSYHFQLRSQGKLGPVAFSTDATLQTLSVNPSIVDPRFVSIGEDSVVMRWETDVPTQTTLQTTDTATGQTQVLTDVALLKGHTMTVSDLLSSHSYTLQITSTDESGNISQSSVIPFSTTTSTTKPTISQVKITSSLVSNNSQSTQTIVSWQTDKPSTSQVEYYEAGNETQAKFTPEITDLVRSHVVVLTNFKPGVVYTIKAKSTDGSKNVTVSEAFTNLTPEASGSVIDMIFSSLNQTFGFLHR